MRIMRVCVTNDVSSVRFIKHANYGQLLEPERSHDEGMTQRTEAHKHAICYATAYSTVVYTLPYTAERHITPTHCHLIPCV